MCIVAGLLPPDGGEIRLRGAPVHLASAEAARRGIAMVHQHFTLVENLTVAENLALALGDRLPWLLPRAAPAEPLAIARRLGWEMDPEARVWQLPRDARQRL